MSLDKAAVLAALRAEDVATHLGISGSWRGRWMRSIRCGVTDHNSEAFGLARDGLWHCHACDTGGDLLKLIALSEKLDVREDFPKVLQIAADIAGVEDEDSFGGTGKPAPKARPPLPAIPPLSDRVALARKRAAWVWGRLLRRQDVQYSVADGYLRTRGLDPELLRKAEDIRETPMRVSMEEQRRPELKSLAYLFGAAGVAVPVRDLIRGDLVDIRVRRAEPRPDQPKIVGMLGGVTDGAGADGRRTLIGCYGDPSAVGAELIILVEGLMDYLTALQVWPGSMVLGAVNAGQMGLVAAHAARALASYEGDRRLIIVEQNDPAGVHHDGTKRIGAADASINEDPNSAAKVAMRILGPDHVGWLLCEDEGEPSAVKDLNDMFARWGADYVKHHVRWS